ncbi:Uncharacterised protein [Bordetella holmesii]|nr:Uncharacterised protein [Bordetella holmesii]
MLVQPQRLIDGLLAQPAIARIDGTVARLARTGPHGWQALDEAGGVLAEGEHIVLANGLGAQAVLQASGLLDDLPRLAQMQAGRRGHARARCRARRRATLRHRR